MLKGVAETTPIDEISDYFTEMVRVCAATRVSDGDGRPMTLQTGFEWVAAQARRAQASGNKMILIGNGGSAAIASHQAIEFLKNGGVRALALNDGASLTALAEIIAPPSSPTTRSGCHEAKSVSPPLPSPRSSAWAKPRLSSSMSMVSAET